MGSGRNQFYNFEFLEVKTVQFLFNDMDWSHAIAHSESRLILVCIALFNHRHTFNTQSLYSALSLNYPFLVSGQNQTSLRNLQCFYRNQLASTAGLHLYIMKFTVISSLLIPCLLSEEEEGPYDPTKAKYPGDLTDYF